MILLTVSGGAGGMAGYQLGNVYGCGNYGTMNKITLNAGGIAGNCSNGNKVTYPLLWKLSSETGGYPVVDPASCGL